MQTSITAYQIENKKAGNPSCFLYFFFTYDAEVCQHFGQFIDGFVE
jgi:hypothetical protein